MTVSLWLSTKDWSWTPEVTFSAWPGRGGIVWYLNWSWLNGGGQVDNE